MTSSNAKLPPIRHPKTKLIMKNLQSKEIYRQHSVEQKKNNFLNSKSNNSSEICSNNDINDSQTDMNLDCKLNLNKIIRSSSSSVLEKRYIFSNIFFILVNNKKFSHFLFLRIQNSYSKI
jgi:hypothetical protein